MEHLDYMAVDPAPLELDIDPTPEEMALCKCLTHCYSIFHITADGYIWSHSQNSCDSLARYARSHPGESIADVPIEEYRHDLTRAESLNLYARYTAPAPRERQGPLASKKGAK